MMHVPSRLLKGCGAKVNIGSRENLRTLVRLLLFFVWGLYAARARVQPPPPPHTTAPAQACGQLLGLRQLGLQLLSEGNGR
jgi:hypothetical protein